MNYDEASEFSSVSYSGGRRCLTSTGLSSTDPDRIWEWHEKNAKSAGLAEPTVMSQLDNSIERKERRKGKRRKGTRPDLVVDDSESGRVRRIEEMLKAAEGILAKSIFYRDLLEKLKSEPVEDLYLLGIGRFAVSSASRFQLALAKLLRKDCGVQRAFAFDPLLTVEELVVLEMNGFVCLEENVEGRYPICVPSLFFVPHCAFALTENILKANWGIEQLAKVVLIGNCLSSERAVVFDRISALQGYMREHALLACPDAPMQAFSDTYLCLFPFSSRKPPELVWKSVRDDVSRVDDDLVTAERVPRINRPRTSPEFMSSS